MTDHEKMDRMSEIENEAIYRFCEKTDFDRTEWMTEDELSEYRKLYKDVNGECSTCGDIINCTCK